MIYTVGELIGFYINSINLIARWSGAAQRGAGMTWAPRAPHERLSNFRHVMTGAWSGDSVSIGY
jgi:hypothetical protein